MSSYSLAKREMFENCVCDMYINSEDLNEIVMTSRQLGECLGYSVPIQSMTKLLERNEYLRTGDFSTVVRLTTLDGKCRETRVFNEDGIMEVTFLAKTDTAKRFRKFARELIKSIRKGEFSSIVTITLDIATKMLENNMF